MNPAALVPPLAQIAQVQRNWILEGLVVAVLVALALAAVCRPGSRQ